jgi:hypothetical protein
VIIQEISNINPVVADLATICQLTSETWQRMRHYSEAARAVCGRSRSVEVKFAEEIGYAILASEQAPDEAALICGICVRGPILIVNVPQLAWFCGRSKSSINDLLTKLGYSALRKRSVTERVALQACPSLHHERPLLRQLTVRQIMRPATFCFCSRRARYVAPRA